MQSDPNANRLNLPRFGGEVSLDGEGCREGIVRVGERSSEGVACGGEDVPVVVGDASVEDLVVARHHPAHGVGVRFPQTRGTLDVGE